jgi:hypothetical protein
MLPKGHLGNFVITPSDGYPTTANLLSLDASLTIPTRFLCFKVSRLHRRTSVRPVLLHLRYSVLVLWINQGTLWFSGEPPESSRTRCSLRQSPLMNRLPRSPGSTLVLRLNHEPSRTSSYRSCHATCT